MPRTVKFDRADVLDNALTTFWDKGFSAVGMRDLETATGLKASSLYNSFGNKEELYLKCVEHFIARYVSRRLSRMKNTEDSLAALINFLFDQYRDGGLSGLPKSCFIGNSHIVAPHLSAEVQQQVDTGQALIDQGFNDLIERGQSRGQIRNDIPSEQLSALLSMTSSGLFLRQSEMALPARRQAIAAAVKALISRNDNTSPRA